MNKEEDLERVFETLKNPDYPSFLITTLLVFSHSTKTFYLYFKTSSILKSIGVKDTISSLLNKESSTGSERYKNLWEVMKARGKKKGAYYFSWQEMEFFLSVYKPRGDEKREAWQMFVDWINSIIQEHKQSAKATTVIAESLEPKKEKNIKLTFTQAAKMMHIGVKKDLVPFLISNKLLYRQRGTLLPFERFVQTRHFFVKEVKVENGTVPQTLITEKGYELIKSKYNELN